MGPIGLVIAAWLAEKLGVSDLNMFHGPLEGPEELSHVDGSVIETSEEYYEEMEGRIGFK